VRLVDDQPCIVAVAERSEPAEVGAIPVHAEDPLGHDPGGGLGGVGAECVFYGRERQVRGDDRASPRQSATVD
jgi:hypothetical protein